MTINTRYYAPGIEDSIALWKSLLSTLWFEFPNFQELSTVSPNRTNRLETENYSVLNDYFFLSPLKLLHEKKFVVVLVSLQYPLCTNRVETQNYSVLNYQLLCYCLLSSSMPLHKRNSFMVIHKKLGIFWPVKYISNSVAKWFVVLLESSRD